MKKSMNFKDMKEIGTKLVVTTQAMESDTRIISVTDRLSIDWSMF